MIMDDSAIHSDPVTARTEVCIEKEQPMLPRLDSNEALLGLQQPWQRSDNRAFRQQLCGGMVVAILLCLFGLGQGYAQSTFGSIRGTVQDPSGAMIPGARVTIHSLDQTFVRDVVTNSSGEYLFENVLPGQYSITAEHDGFSNAVVANAQLAARQDLRIPLVLSVAGQATEVMVEAVGTEINTENGTVSNTMSNLDVTTLPMNSRAVSSSPLASLALSPSVVTDTQGNIAVGGATSAQTGFSVDGISTANVRSNGALHDAYPSSEGISETQVTAFNNNAEFAQIGDVTFTTKSGTSKWHGSAFEYFQNDALDATIYNFSSKAPKNFNAFGGSIGGPVPIRSLKDRTFLFADYEGNRKTQSYPQQLLVPTANDRAGNLNDLVSALGEGAVYNPSTGTPFADNTITTPINPAAKALLAYIPLPNVINQNYYPGNGAAGPSYNYQTLVPIPSNTDGWDLRVDETLTSKQSIYTRFSWKNLMYSEGGSGATANVFLPNITANDQNRSLLVSYNYAMRNNMVNEFRYGFTNFTENDAFPIQGSAAISGLGLQGIDISSHATGYAFPTFSFNDGSFNGIGQDRVGTTISQTDEFTDNLTWTLGKHTIKVGADARYVRYNALMFFQPSDDFGDFIFAPSTFTNYAFGDLYLGLPEESFFAITSPQINAMSTQWGIYGQDEWQLNKHLTVNFGLRWELLPAFDESQGDLASFDAAKNAVIVPDSFLTPGSPTKTANSALQSVYDNFRSSFDYGTGCPVAAQGAVATAGSQVTCSNLMTAGQDGVTQGLRQLYKGDFDPRISLAYRPFSNDKTVIRAGFGIFTQTTLGPMSFNNAGNPTSNLVTNTNAHTTNSQGATTNMVVAGSTFQFPNTSPCSLSSACTTGGGGSLEQANDPHFRDPQAAQWNLTVEREITPNTVVRASYVGMSNYRLPVTIDWNQVEPSTIAYNAPGNLVPYQNWTLLMSSENIGHSSYQAGIAEVSHKLSHGLTLEGSYTWAKNLSDAQGSAAPTVFASEEAYAVEATNRFNLSSDRGNVVATPRHRALITGTYQLPFGAGRTWHGPSYVNAVLGGWDLSTVTTMQTGQWLTPTTSPAFDQSNTGMEVRSGGGALLRPDCGFGNQHASTTSGVMFNIGAFQNTPAGAGRFGTCGVGILEGPNMINVNSGLAKTTSFHERYKLRFEATFTNVINRANFASPQTNISNSNTFGSLSYVGVLPQGQGGNRTGQLAIRFDF